MQACWALMLDDDFLEAYVHGIVVECGDGITRRLYPRIFTYSADYPEKSVLILLVSVSISLTWSFRILLCSIRDLGGCPCPRCCIPMKQVPDMGTKFDARRREKLIRKDDEDRHYKVGLARRFIYEQGRNINSEAVEKVLKPQSLTPTRVSHIIFNNVHH
jgi:hypothetical protein